MKISFDPMPALRDQAVVQCNAFFARFNPHIDQAYRRKKEIASLVIQGVGKPTEEFTSEATLRNISAAEFAALIISKPDPIDARELVRQTTLAEIKAATSPDQLEKILNNLHSQF